MKTKSKKKWIPFYFEGNLKYNLVDSPEKWNEVKKTYNHLTTDELLAVKRSEYYDKPYFGWGLECQGKETLQDFFEAEGMEK